MGRDCGTPSSVDILVNILVAGAICSLVFIAFCSVTFALLRASSRLVTLIYEWMTSRKALYNRLEEDLRASKPLYVIEALVSRYPRIARRVDKRGRTLLHWSCAYNASFEAIHFLVQQNPEAVQLLDDTKNTPLHLLLGAGRNKAQQLQSVRLLAEKFNGATVLPNGTHGSTPLHNACGNGATKDVIEYLGRRGLAAAYLLRDKDGRLPLDLASKRRDLDAGAIDFLVNATKDAACALIEVIWERKAVLPMVAVAHVVESIGCTVSRIDHRASGSSGSGRGKNGPVMDDAGRSQLDVDMIKMMVDNERVQALLRRRYFQSYISKELLASRSDQKGEEASQEAALRARMATKKRMRTTTKGKSTPHRAAPISTSASVPRAGTVRRIRTSTTATPTNSSAKEESKEGEDLKEEEDLNAPIRAVPSDI